MFEHQLLHLFDERPSLLRNQYIMRTPYNVKLILRSFDFFFPVALEDVLDLFVDGLRSYAVLEIVGLLEGPAALGFGDCPPHRVARRISIHDHKSRGIARRPANDLNEARLRAQKADLVGIENRDKRDFGQVDPLAQQVDADEDIEFAGAQLGQNFDALDGLHLRVNVSHAQAQAAEVFRELLGHLFGERDDETPLSVLRPLADAGVDVLHLAFRGRT